MKSTISETDLYYYHPDHLGSSSWITDAGGQAIQHLQYLPFGETKVDQRLISASWNTRFSFSAKEKDEESGYSYFGARYYDSELSIWLSVDPMSDKYPGLTPYAYCANNPVKLVDPNGEEIWIAIDDNMSVKYENGNLYNKDGSEYIAAEGSFAAKTQSTLNQIRTGGEEGNSLVNQLQEKGNTYNIKAGKESGFQPTQIICNSETQKMSRDGNIMWNPNGEELPTTSGMRKDPLASLGHEMFHALDAKNGTTDNQIETNGIKNGEWRAVYGENLLRSEQGLPLRTHYRKSNDFPCHGVGPLMIKENPRSPYLPNRISR